MVFLRKIVFYIFLGIYFILCPLILLYAFGYIYKPGPREHFVQMGVIYLSTAPTGATVYLNDKPYQNKTPTFLPELKPGKYNVKITLDDYKPWQQDVPVEAAKSTVLDKILLMPEEWTSTTLLPGNFKDIIPINKSGLFLLTVGPALGNIAIYDYQDSKQWALLEEGSPLDSYTLHSYFLVDESPAGLFHVKAGEQDKLLWIEFAEDANNIKDVTDLFKTVPREVKWLPQSEWMPDQERNLFTYKDGNVNRIEVIAGAVYPEYIKEAKGYDLFNNEIYILKESNVFFKMDLDKKGKTAILDDTKLGSMVFGGEEYFDVEVLSDQFIIFIGENGRLLTNHLPYHVVESGVKGSQPHLELEHVLVWTKDRIGILDFSTEETGSVTFEKGPELTWIYTVGKNIEQCFWIYDGAHVLFRDAKDIFILETTEYGAYTLSHIFQVQEKSSVYYSEDEQKLYFIDADTSELRSVDIVPQKGVDKTPFPHTDYGDQLKKEEGQ